MAENPRNWDNTAPVEDFDDDDGPNRHAVPDGSAQAGNAASTNPGGGEMGIAPLEDTNRNTNLDRKRREFRPVALRPDGTPADWERGRDADRGDTG